MALIKCSECGKDISDQATSCPGCGCPVKHEQDAPPQFAQQNAQNVPPQFAQQNTQNVPPHFAQQNNSPNPSVNTGARPKKKGHGCLTTVIVILALMVIFIFAGVSNETKSRNASAESSVVTKEEAQNIDDEIWAKVIEVMKINNDLLQGMDGYGNGTVSELDLYDYCKEADKYLGSLSLSYPKNKNENIKPYIDSCESYTLYVQLFASSVVKYIDDPQTKNLSDVKANIESSNTAATLVANNRGVFLSKMGFSEEEIKEKGEKIADQLGESAGTDTASDTSAE